MAQSDIVIRGAREHNLRDVNLRLPRNKLIVMTGVSGSGKSSLAFDTLYAEGQRRYVESLSSYARQFLGQMPKPQVDAISGLAPSISIQQKTSGRNPRSTVGTITEIYDYLRVLFARVGTGNCSNCGRPITAQTTEQIIEKVSELPDGARFQVLAPLIQQQKGEYRDLFEDLLKQGFLRARVDGVVVQLIDDLQLDRQMRHNIEVVVDRLIAGTTSRSRLAESIETALRLAGGTLIIAPSETDSGKPNQQSKVESVSEQLYSSHYACTHCNLSFEPPSPQLFSFNSPLGMCLECNGLGQRHEFVLEHILPDPTLSINKGAFPLIGKVPKIGKWRRHIYEGIGAAIEQDTGLKEGAFLKAAWKDLPPLAQDLFLYGLGERNITYSWRYSGGIWKHGGKYHGLIDELLTSYRKTKSGMRRRQLEKYMQFVNCSACQGSRLNPQARAVTLTTSNEEFKASGNNLSVSLPEACSLSIYEAALFFESLELEETSQLIATEVLKEIRGRLGFLLRCGLDYLTLDRTAPTLSGGETQRIRLAGQIGCGLVGVVYILDEPSIGLHARDNAMLLQSLCDLRDQGNTVIVVEHDEETMRAADYIVDFGPGPGTRGGKVVAQGSLAKIKRSRQSVTSQFLTGKQEIAVPDQRRKVKKTKAIKVVGAEHNNLKCVDAAFPLNAFICVTGVSGSGKSSLVNDILWQVLNRDVNEGNGSPGKHKRVNGLKSIDKAIDISQSPIGRTPRSNPATYVKLFDEIRKLYTMLPESKVRGYKPGRFSFNVAAGRCEACEGHGANKLEMDFLADIWVTCPICEGRRFNHETLEIRFKGKNIAEVLDMEVREAMEHFENHPKIFKLLSTLDAVGLDYLKLGQPSPTLSGGEAQRIKLARELGKRSTGQTFYLLDEPTTGLHFADIQKLLEVLHGFVEAGNTVLVVEHNLDVIKTADWIIDIGPEGGAGGGKIIAQGTPEQVAAAANSYTGQALSEVLPSRPEQVREVPAAAKPQQRKLTRSQQDSNNERWQIAQPLTQQTNGNGKRSIVVNGAKQHNLQGIDLQIPRDKMNVFCGPSGSGKSSLAMDTLYAEGQRRYVESLSAYARQFLGQMPKPRVEHIHGLSPSIAIEQKNLGSTPRSTVGTVTEIYDYLRILFARLGSLHCPDCKIPVDTQTTDEVIDRILEAGEGTRLLVLAPQEVRVGQSYERLWESLQAQGYRRVRVNGETYKIEDVPTMDRRRKHQVEVVVDRITVSRRKRSRIADSIESALDMGRGFIRVAHCDDELDETDWRVERFSLLYACEKCGRGFEELTPHSFSFNSPLGWCDSCEGLGTEQGTNLTALVGRGDLSLRQQAVSAWPNPTANPMFSQMLEAMLKECRIPGDVPFDDLSPTAQRAVLYGTGERWIPFGKDGRVKFQYKGLYPALEEASRTSYTYRVKLMDMVGEVPCSSCGGSRLRDDASAVRFSESTIQHLCEMPLEAALKFLKDIKLSATQKRIAGELLTEAVSRLSFLVEVGLDYLSLSRPLPTLSGGEVQRIRLAGQIGRALTGVLYVLDEPTIGLHPRDNNRLLKALKRLRNLGNTLVLVEHDREVLESADRLYDFGPGAGRFGGTVTDAGTPKQLGKSKRSMTGQFLSSQRTIAIPDNRRMPSAKELQDIAESNIVAGRPKLEDHDPPGGGWLELVGARQHNLRNVDLRVPLGTLTCVTGVSGSGKSSLVEHTLARAIAKRLHRAGDTPGPFDELNGLQHINKLIVVDQQPLGNTPKSNPGTYTGVFEHIRALFARLPEAKVRGYGPGRFSFNRPGGRCEACEGNGQKCIEMHFLPDVWVECDECRGFRYNQETLSVKYRGKSIADVLNMSIGEAYELFENIPKIRGFLATLTAIGLDYVTLGQSAPTLSGGEAQRVKLAAELARPNTGKTLYLLDEPTTGLHFDDIEKLLKVINSLVELGNSVVVIEHNLDVIKSADWVIDIGPEAGHGGGWIVAEGTPEDIVQYAQDAQAKPTNGAKRKTRKKPKPYASLQRSHTGEMLAATLAQGDYGEREAFDVKDAASKREGDISMAQIGHDARMPWEVDGVKWHTEQRVSYRGAACHWEGEALQRVVETIEAFDPNLFVTNWNDRATVETTGQVKKHGWFFHGLTGDEWTVKFKFRVTRNRFKRDVLQQKLRLRPLDDIDEIPIYGRGDRVTVKNLKGPWQEVTVTVHWLKEIDTPEFWGFLSEACQSFKDRTEHTELNPKDLTPWKVLGKKWHLSRKGFPSNKRVDWKPEVLEKLITVMDEVHPDAIIDWTNRQMVHFRHVAKQPYWAMMHTKRRPGLELYVYAEPGEITLGQISDFGKERDISTHRDGREVARIQFTTVSQLNSKKLKDFLKKRMKASKPPA
ncbi:MAG: excinuclease ABC subunit A [Planctomycetaceae bacterium]|nr:excinuclease ABC subunit A [Planctomycetaceae bacterium]